MGSRDDQAILYFRLEDRWFGVDAYTVEEVVSQVKPTPVPGTPAYIQGVFDLHGRAVAVMDVARFLDLPVAATKAPHEGNGAPGRVVVVRVDQMSVGILAQEVREIVETPQDRIRNPQMSADGRLSEFAVGELDLGALVVTLVDLPALVHAAKV